MIQTMPGDPVGPDFKRLTEDNWRDPDPAGQAFGEINLATGEERPMTAQRWAQRILAVHLNDDVPADVRDLWEVARGVLLYGYFFYPLYMLGDEQLHRVADAAILHRYRQLGGPTHPRTGDAPSFAPRLEWLIDNGHIPASLKVRWDAIRGLRNLGSHAERQSLQMPISALNSLSLLATHSSLRSLIARSPTALSRGPMHRRLQT
jgi:hypothetical protein